jgi:hypothetical protein
MRLDAPFEPTAVFVPSEIDIDGDKLLWTMRAPKFVLPKGSVLERFVKLHAGTGEDILKFATCFGVGWFCNHGLPGSHAQTPSLSDAKSCFPVARDNVWFEERLTDYLRFSRGAEAVVRSAGMVNSEQIPSDDLLMAFAHFNRPLVLNLMAFPHLALKNPERIPRRYMLDSARMQIAHEIDLWVQMSQARPHLDWNPQRKTWQQTIAHSPWGVLGAVGLAMFTTAPQAGGWLICSICGDSFPADRARPPERNKYCPDCRKSSRKWKFLKQQQRELLKQQRRGENDKKTRTK